ncbi:MAG: limonene-1,2-epoxide hydrolase family protein [Acidimicrobiia bacterium]
MTAEEIVNAFTVRITALDFDGAFELVADDIEYDNVPIGKVSGPEGIRGVFATLDAMGVNAMEWTVHRQVANATTVMNERTDSFSTGDRTAAVDVMGVFEVADGRITLWRDYFDMNAMTEAITALAG